MKCHKSERSMSLVSYTDMKYVVMSSNVENNYYIMKYKVKSKPIPLINFSFRNCFPFLMSSLSIASRTFFNVYFHEQLLLPTEFRFPSATSLSKTLYTCYPRTHFSSKYLHSINLFLNYDNMLY